jgi:hypothetical protein
VSENSALTDPRSVERRVMTDGRPAPSLMVRYACGKCKLSWVLDAYIGPPSCNIHKEFLNPVSLVKHGHPLADIEAIRQTTRGNFV